MALQWIPVGTREQSLPNLPRQIGGRISVVARSGSLQCLDGDVVLAGIRQHLGDLRHAPVAASLSAGCLQLTHRRIGEPTICQQQALLRPQTVGGNGQHEIGRRRRLIAGIRLGFLRTGERSGAGAHFAQPLARKQAVIIIAVTLGGPGVKSARLRGVVGFFRQPASPEKRSAGLGRVGIERHLALEGLFSGFHVAGAKREPTGLPIGVRAAPTVRKSLCHFAEEAAGGSAVILQQIHVGRGQQSFFKPGALGRGGAQLSDVVGDQLDVRAGKLGQVIKPLRAQIASRVRHATQ